MAGKDVRNEEGALARTRRRIDEDRRRGARAAPRFDTELVERMEAMEPGAMARHDLSSAAMRAGDKLRALRLALGWSQTRLARAAGLDPSVLSAYEAGRGKDGPTFANLERIAAAAGMQVAFVPAGEELPVGGRTAVLEVAEAVVAGRVMAAPELADRMVAQMVQAIDHSVEHRLDRLFQVLRRWEDRLPQPGQEPLAKQDAQAEVETPDKVKG